MNRFIWLVAIFLLVAVVVSSSNVKNDDTHSRNEPDARSAVISRAKRNLHRAANKRMQFSRAQLTGRKKRNQVDDHALRAEADSLAAAAESVAAGDNAAAAAIEIEEERQIADHGQSGQQGGYESDANNAESDASNEVEVNQQDSEEQENDVAAEETIHEKTKRVHKHKSSEAGDSQTDDVSSGESSQSETSVSKSKDDVAINKLMTQSSELARQIKMVFDLMAKRESYLVDEMQKLQTSLTEAINVLKTDDTVTIDGSLVRKRRAEEPYRACVYIESAVENLEQGHGHHRAKRNTIGEHPLNSESMKYRPEVLVKSPNDNGQNPAQNIIGGHETNVPNENSEKGGIDLSTVYWFKLPDEQSLEQVHDKIQKILSGIRASDRDVLLIPVTKTFTSKQQVANAFLNVFRTKRSVQQKRLKSKLAVEQV